ncbi:MAG: asparagine synthase-related protein [Candidatus Thorarchaeota archaeon]
MTGISGYLGKASMPTWEEVLGVLSFNQNHRGEYTEYRYVRQESKEQMAVLRVHHLSSLPDYKIVQSDSGLSIMWGFNLTKHIQNHLEKISQYEMNHDFDLVESQLLHLFGVNVIQVNSNGISLFRSRDGMIPIYHAVDDVSLVLSSERKALWALGNKSPAPIEPGQCVFYSWEDNLKMSETKRAAIERPVKGSENEILQELSSLLDSSFNRLLGIQECGILFSGGIDSSLVAHLTSLRCERTLLFTTSSPDSHDNRISKGAAEKLGLDIIQTEMNAVKVWEILPQVIYAIETSKRMDVEIAIPFFLAAKEASQQGVRIMISGQGPDELFAGYARHVRILEDEGPAILKKQLYDEVSTTHENNLERDERAVAANGLTTYFPYVDPEFVSYALEVPIQYKVDIGQRPERKVIFRKLAIQMGLPADLAIRPKKATQYSSGSSKILIDAIRLGCESLREKSKKEIEGQVQDVLDIIGRILGIHIEDRVPAEIEVDLSKTQELKSRIGRFSHQQ